MAKITKTPVKEIFMKAAAGDPLALYTALFLCIERSRDGLITLLLETIRDRLRSDLLESKKGRQHVAAVQHNFEHMRKSTLTLRARFATVTWLQGQGVPPVDVFAAAGDALQINEGTVRNAYFYFKKNLPPEKLPFYEKTDPSTLPLGPDQKLLRRTLVRHTRRKKPA